MGWFRRIQQFVGVEPVIFFYSYWLFMMWPVMNQYMYYRISEDKGFPYKNISGSEGGCSEDSFGANSSLKELEIEVQTESANLFFYYIIACTIPSLAVAPFIGSYTDRAGRKPGLAAPLIGAMLETALTLVMMYLKLSLVVVVVGGVINALTGYMTTLMLAVMSYIADCVSKKKLAFRLAVMQLSMFIAATISQLTSGLWIENLGFIMPLWFLLGCLVMTLLYVIFLLQETRQVTQDEKVAFFSLKSLKVIFDVFKKPRAGGRRNLLLIIVFLGINILATVGTGSAQLLLVLRSPLCWGPSILGYYLSYRFFTYGVGAAIGIPILKKCFRELNIARIGYLSQIAGLLLFAFAEKTWMIFIVPVAGILAGCMDPILMGISSKIVSTDEQGCLFCAIGILSTLGELLGTSLFNNLYPVSLKFGFPGFVFVLAAGIFLIVLILTRFLDIPYDIINSSHEKSDDNENAVSSELAVFIGKKPEPDVDAKI